MVVLVPLSVLERPPSRDDGVSEEEEDQLRRFGGRLIQRAGVLLKLPQLTVVSAAAMFQRFYFCKSFAEYDVRSLAAAALMLASKLEEHPRKLVEVIQVCYRLKMRELKEDGAPVYEGKPTPQLDPNKREYHDEKKEVVLGERRILRELGFEVALLLDHPHRYAIEFIERLNRPDNLAQKVWNLLNDSIQTSLCCSHQPQDIAGACLLLGARELNLTLPSKPPWWKQFSVDVKDAEQIAEELAGLYDKEPPEFIDVVRPKEVAPPATPWTSPPPMLMKSPSDELFEEPEEGEVDHLRQESHAVEVPPLAEVLAEGEAILAEMQPKEGLHPKAPKADDAQGFDKPEAKKTKSNGKKDRTKERKPEAKERRRARKRSSSGSSRSRSPKKLERKTSEVGRKAGRRDRKCQVATESDESV